MWCLKLINGFNRLRRSVKWKSCFSPLSFLSFLSLCKRRWWFANLHTFSILVKPQHFWRISVRRFASWDYRRVQLSPFKQFPIFSIEWSELKRKNIEIPRLRSKSESFLFKMWWSTIRSGIACRGRSMWKGTKWNWKSKVIWRNTIFFPSKFPFKICLEIEYSSFWAHKKCRKIRSRMSWASVQVGLRECSLRTF